MPVNVFNPRTAVSSALASAPANLTANAHFWYDSVLNPTRVAESSRSPAKSIACVASPATAVAAAATAVTNPATADTPVFNAPPNFDENDDEFFPMPSVFFLYLLDMSPTLSEKSSTASSLLSNSCSISCRKSSVSSSLLSRFCPTSRAMSSTLSEKLLAAFSPLSNEELIFDDKSLAPFSMSDNFFS